MSFINNASTLGVCKILPVPSVEKALLKKISNNSISPLCYKLEQTLTAMTDKSHILINLERIRLIFLYFHLNL